jgi:hypothetical protein
MTPRVVTRRCTITAILRGQPSLFCAWVHGDSSPTLLLPLHTHSLLLLSILSPSLCSPSLATSKPAHHRPCGPIALPSSAEGATTSSRSNQRLTALSDHFSPYPASSVSSCHRPTTADLLRPSQRLEELCKTPLSLFDHTSTTGDPPSMPLMSFPFRHFFHDELTVASHHLCTPAPSSL